MNLERLMADTILEHLIPRKDIENFGLEDEDQRIGNYVLVHLGTPLGLLGENRINLLKRSSIRLTDGKRSSR